jgi:hypothetical protein
MNDLLFQLHPGDAVMALVVVVLLAIGVGALTTRTASGDQLPVDWPRLLDAIESVESGGRPEAVGDVSLEHQAMGSMQIRQPCLDDVNRVAGTSFQLAEVASSRTLSRWCAIIYLRHWGAAYERETGREPTAEVLARIHNGGPRGWKRKSTLAYWEKVEARYLRAL